MGTSSTDSESHHLKKISITLIPLSIAPISLLWSIVYFNLGYPIAAFIPLLYTFISMITLYDFHKTKNILLIQKTQMFMILIFPFLLTWVLGGFHQSSSIFLWAFFAPISALLHDKKSHTQFWLFSFIALILLSTLINNAFIETAVHPIEDWVLQFFTFLNITLVFTAVYFLLRYTFIKKEKNSQEQLQMKHNALLNNTKELYDNISYLESYKHNIDYNLIVTRTDILGVITFANQNFYNLTGYSKEDVLGNTHSIIRHPDNSDSLFEQLWGTILSKKTWHGRLKNRKKDGSSYWIDTTISPILNKDNEIVEFIAIRHDITKLIEQQDALTQMLYSDALTNLKNRNSLAKELSTSLHHSLMLINIDNFSHINNLYGEKFGDKILIQFSNFLQNVVKSYSYAKLFRLSGDEFVILFTKTTKKEIEHYAADLLETNTHATIDIDEQIILLDITIGISYEANTQLISSANMAITAARENSRSLTVYTDKLSLNDEYENNLRWIKEIKDAIADDRITVFFQPIIDHKDASIIKYESLIRLIDKQGNIISPYFFLEIAKKAKLYKQLTKIVITKSFTAFKENDYEFSVNLTIEDILDKDINKYIINILKENKNIAKRLIFEIVESESIENFEKVEKFITMIKKYGCRISIDDFGTGYSNFEYLMRLQADFIKIDGSIIKEIVKDKRSAIITSTIVSFAQKMNIQTIGEFVETKEINDKLIKLGVDKSQGYYFGKPQASLAKKQL